MNKTHYYLAIFLTGILFIIGCYQNLIFYQLGPQTYALESFRSWYLTLSIVNFLVTVVLLQYFHLKNYKVAFYAGIGIAVASIAHFTVVYDAFTAKILSAYFPLTFSLILIASLLLYGALSFSRAKERVWLKITGITGIIQTLAMAILFVWITSFSDFQLSMRLNTLASKISLAGGVISALFYLLNFTSEIKKAPAYPRSSFQKAFTGFVAVTAIGSLVAVFYIGQQIAHEKHDLLRWVNRGPEGAEALANPFEARTHISSDGDTLRYRLLMPLNYDPAKKYPLAVCLHGGGGSGTDNVKQIEGSWMAQMLSKYPHRKEYPAFVFVPQCPPGSTWGGQFPGVTRKLPTVDSLVFDAISALEREFAIDKRRRYVMGASLGGYGTWHFVTKRPEMFAAAVPICGGGNPDFAEKLVDVPLWVFHGARDRSVPVRLSREMIEAIKNAGGDPRYSEYPNEGHIISEQVFNTPGLLDWIFQQMRK